MALINVEEFITFGKLGQRHESFLKFRSPQLINLLLLNQPPLTKSLKNVIKSRIVLE